MSDIYEGKPFRVLPRLTPDVEPFWTSGADGVLRFLRCQQCGTYVHPPAPICPEDLSRELDWEAVSGKATVHSYTVNHQPWYPGFDPPYVVGLVELAEDSDVRLMTNIVGCDPADVHIGMAVRVTFAQYGETYLPLFEPDPGAVADAAAPTAGDAPEGAR